MIPEASRPMLEAIFAQRDNAGVLRHLKLRLPSDVWRFEPGTEGHPLDEGGQVFFHRYGRSVPSAARCSLQLCNLLVHPRTARIFALHEGRFTMALRFAHRTLSPLNGETLDGEVDLVALGPPWGLFYADDDDEAAEAFRAAYELAGEA